MFYYAEINSEYQVINKHCLSEESTNPNYIPVTEDLYSNGNELGDIVGQFYNTLLDVIEIVDPNWDMGQTCWMRYKDSQMRLSTKLDNMDKTTSLKANINHTHEGYASSNHVHTSYASSDDLQVLEDVVDTKANSNHTHSNYADVNHSHLEYASQTSVDEFETKLNGKADATHNHAEYALSSHEHDYAEVGHNHNSIYAPLIHGHNEYVTTTNFEILESEVDGKAPSTHTHTASEIGAATSIHNHDSEYSNIAHDHDEDYAPLSHSHTNYATTSALSELSSIVSGKANTSHSHNIANITNLQSALDEKAATNHGTHVSYSTTAPVMDGSASVGTASTIARSDHKHPTDTSRAAQTALDSHTSNKSNPHGVTISQLGLTATASEINVLDGITATTAELNYVDGVTSNIQTQINGKAASNHTHNYAGSSSVGGAATSANKLNTDAGSTTQPVYFSNGIPVATTYTLGKSVPSDAKFTDTTYNVVTVSANGLMSSSDKTKLDGMVLATVSEVETYLGI